MPPSAPPSRKSRAANTIAISAALPQPQTQAGDGPDAPSFGPLPGVQRLDVGDERLQLLVGDDPAQWGIETIGARPITLRF